MSAESSHGKDIGPDLVIAGAARSGTTQLAALLAMHPGIDASAVKETNYFSRRFDSGPEWYDGYFAPRSPQLRRMDASVSYTYPQYPDALARLMETSPRAQVVYVVRDPVERAVSHYLLYRHYFGHESAETFGASLRERTYYLDVSDYGRWLDELKAVVPAEQLLVVPFRALTATGRETAELVLRRLGLDPLTEVNEQGVEAHQNNVVTFRNETARRATRKLRHSPLYPLARRLVGPHGMKRLRSLVTRVPDMPSVDEALLSCGDSERAAIADVANRAYLAVQDHLVHQDEALGVEWGQLWEPPRAVTGGE
jgi:hypothetical protein